MYEVGTKIYDEKSPKNRRIISLFVKKEILKDVTNIVEYILDTGTNTNAPPFTWEDIESLDEDTGCPECGENAMEEVVVEPSAVTPEYDPDADADEKYVCPICGTPYGTADDAKNCCAGEIAYRCSNCGKMMSSADYEDMIADSAVPIAHWYLVSDWFCLQAEEAGDPVIGSASLWGRPADAPALEEDQLVATLCRRLGILEGLPHEWPV